MYWIDHMAASAQSVIKLLVNNFSQDRIATQSAALAYYMIFSLVPIILICISIAGIVLGEEAARGEIFTQIGGFIGKEPALQVQNIIAQASKPSTIPIRIMGILILFLSASGFFSELQAGLNLIWGVKSPNKGWLGIIKDRVLSFAIVLGVAFLLLISLILSAFLATFNSYFSPNTGGLINLIISDVISLGITTLLFAMIFKVLPDVEIQWRDVWEGALFTAILFALGKLLIDFYLNQVQVTSAFGVAGSFIIILVWVYYSAQIFFIGAEITKIFSIQKGKNIIPARNAVVINKM